MTNLINRIRRPRPQLNFQEEMKRRAGRRQTLLRAFQERGELTTKDLSRFGTGVSSRIHELRSSGHIIVQQYVEPGLYRYVYKGKK